METLCHRAASAAAGIVRTSIVVALAAALFTGTAQAQTPPQQTQAQAAPGAEQNRFPVRQTVFLQHATRQQELNDIQTDLRNLFPRMKVYGVSSQLAISLAGMQEDVDGAQKVIAELDRPIKTYRLTYTLTEFDDGARGATQKYVLTTASGQRTEFMEGTKVPLITALPEKPDSSAGGQVQYVDVGLKIRATPESSADGLRLDSRIEQSSVTGERPTGGAQDPTLNQTVLDTTANLAESKPQVLGSLDVPGTAKRLEVTVSAEQVR